MIRNVFSSLTSQRDSHTGQIAALSLCPYLVLFVSDVVDAVRTLLLRTKMCLCSRLIQVQTLQMLLQQRLDSIEKQK
jgi:hypothetical protein